MITITSGNVPAIVYQSDESGRLEVYVRSFPEAAAKQQISTGGGEFPVWSRDGDEVFYLDGDKMMAVDVFPDDMRLGKPRLFFEMRTRSVTMMWPTTAGS